MRILMIGGTRFIGLATTKRLHSLGHDVAVFNRGQTPVELPDGVRHIQGNTAQLSESRAAFVDFAPDVVMHNIVVREKNAADLLEVFTGIAKRVVMVSSMDVYRAYGRLNGTEPGDPIPFPGDEDSPLREVWYPYRAQAKDEDDFRYHYDKIPAENLILNSKDLPGTVLRLPMVYGENDFQHRLLPFIKQMDDKREAIVLEENYTNWRSTFGYVENIAHGIALACMDDRANGRVYNVADMTPSMLELGEMVKQKIGWQGEFVILPTAELPESLHNGLDPHHSLVYKWDRISSELGYQPIVGRDEALDRTIAWEREHLSTETNYAEVYGYAAQDEVLARLKS